MSVSATDQLRPVMVYQFGPYDVQLRACPVVVRAPARFHGWGSDYDEFESGPASFSTAIVEFADGSVDNVHVRLIRFTDIASC